jgi:hypothetical protein
VKRRYAVAAFDPNGQRTGDTGRTFRTRYFADRERKAYSSGPRIPVPLIVDGQPDWTRLVPLVTYRVVEVEP